MKAPAEARVSHSRLSERFSEFLDLVETMPEAWRPVAYDGRELPEWVAQYAYPVHGWPTFVSGEKLREIRGTTVDLCRLLKSVPERVFDNDIRRIVEFYGLPSETMATAFLEEPNGVSEALARGDFIDTDEGLKCVEYNMSSCLGGWQVRFFASELLEKPWIRTLLNGESGPARYVDPLQSLFTHLVEQARASDLVTDTYNVAFLVSDTDWDSVAEAMLAYVAKEFERFVGTYYPGFDGRMLYGNRGAVVSNRHGVFLAGVQVHAMIEYHGTLEDPELFRCFKSGKVKLYNAPALLLLGDKRNLALLSENARSGRFDAGEQALIEAHVPWTRIVQPGPTEYRGDRVVFPRFLLDQRRNLVLKHAYGGRGEGIFIGGGAAPERWEAAVHEALDDGYWIVQEYVESRPYWYYAGGDAAIAHDVIWGLFSFGDRYGGGFLRMKPKGGYSAINSAQGATQGMILEIDRKAPAPWQRGARARPAFGRR